MSNTSLKIDCIKKSPNHSGERTHKIDRITIHHMSGNLTVSQCGDVFLPSSRQASSNYGVDSKGRIGLYVDEKNRPWTSSSAENDNRAVTIEVANSTGGPDWKVSDKALETTIYLCADICLRNGIKALNYTGDTTGNLTMHKWFASTDCPGPYLGGKFPYIAEQVNKLIKNKNSWFNGKVGALLSFSSSIQEADKTYSWKAKKNGGFERNSKDAYSNAVKIYAALDRLGYGYNAVCALLGNFDAESNYNPWQYESNAVQSSSGYTAFGGGYGLAQFTPASKYISSSKAKSLDQYGPNFSDKTGKPEDGEAQLIWIDKTASSQYYATNSYPESYSEFKKSTKSVDYLVKAWVYNYERPGVVALERRLTAAKYWEDKLNDIKPSGKTSSESGGFVNIEIDYTKISPYILTLDRNSTTKLDYQNLKTSHRVIGVILEAGYLYTSSHKEVTFRNPLLYEQIPPIENAELPYGYYMIGRARTLSEVENELYWLSFIINKYPPKLGVWLKLDLDKKRKSHNNSIIATYEEGLIKLGLKGKIGLMLRREQLKLFSWSSYQDSWYLWLIEHIKDTKELDSLIDPKFFDTDDTPDDPELVKLIEQAEKGVSDSRDKSSSSSTTLSTGGSLKGGFVWPAPGTTMITSGVGPRWGTTHNGIDISSGDAQGKPVVASAAGTVAVANKSGWGGGYGLHVMIDHKDGYRTIYGHGSAVHVNVGDVVKKGQHIMDIGSTGDSTGPHLHFEIRKNGQILDPEKYVSPV